MLQQSFDYMAQRISVTNFNEEQLKAIRHREGPMMVLAGPGSGKTTVLINRIRCLKELHAVKEEEMLVITFTRAAAEEMRLRYQKLSGKTSAAVTFGTFHSVFYGFLREHQGGVRARLSEGKECLLLLREILQRDFQELRLTADMAELLLHAFSRMKNDGSRPAFPLPPAVFGEIFDVWSREKKERGIIDFDDMLYEFLKLLRRDKAFLLKLQNRFSYLMVDEFQDINQTQYEIVKLLAAPKNNLFIVGDDDQSIYAFRGSKPELMLHFKKDYPDAKEVLLSVNYRSAEPVVRASLKLISHNKMRYQKALSANRKGGAAVRIQGFPTEEAQAEAVFRALWLLRDAGEPLSGAAILFRTSKAAAKFRKRLKEAGMYRDEPALSSFKEEPPHHRALPKNDGAQTGREQRDKAFDAPVFMTFHGAKGLEFPTVFIICAEEGITPHLLSEQEEAIEEERRMFYVAMTRAKNRLHIFYTNSPYNRNKRKSRFVTEMEEGDRRSKWKR